MDPLTIGLVGGALSTGLEWLGNKNRKVTTLAQSAGGVNDAFGKMSPEIESFTDRIGKASSYNSAGMTGADVAKSYKRQSDQFGNTIGGQESSLINDKINAADKLGGFANQAFTNAGTQSANNARNLRITAMQNGLMSNPAKAAGLFGSLGSSSNDDMMKNFANASNIAASTTAQSAQLKGDAMKDMLAAKQSNYALNVSPYEMKRDGGYAGLAGSSMNSMMSAAMAQNQQDNIVAPNPLAAFAQMGGTVMGRGMGKWMDSAWGAPITPAANGTKLND